MKYFLGVLTILLAAGMTHAQFANQAAEVPAFHPARPPAASKLPPILTEKQLADQGLIAPAQVASYKAAAKAGSLLYQMPCYCYCDRNHGHASLRSCFEGTHGASCGTCIPTEIQTVCAGLDPKFGYNAQSVEANDNKSLHVLAECMKNGPLSGKTLKLVGHADNRGTQDYNDRLGKRRAEAVKMYLMKTGIASERLVTASVGKDGSSVTPEDWDRRVDFELVN